MFSVDDFVAPLYVVWLVSEKNILCPSHEKINKKNI